MSFTLRPYQPTDADVITTWLKSEYLTRQWCADRYKSYPVTADDMNSYHQQYIDGQRSVALTMVDGEDIVGYITLRIHADVSTEQRLGFVIVDDSRRGQGLGKSLVSMAVDYAFRKLGATKVSLGVFENNPAAIRCYESVDFRRVIRRETESYECLGETWKCIEMEYHNNVTIRTIEPDEVMLLTDFLYEAIYQPDGNQKVSRTVLQHPMIWAYVKDFGKLPDDVCLVAIVDELIVGATWSRLGCSYGKFNESIPELAISVYPEYRGKGIGTRLLSHLLDLLHKKGYAKISLSVDKSNYATGMYLKSGFEILKEREHDYLMVKRWKNNESNRY